MNHTETCKKFNKRTLWVDCRAEGDGGRVRGSRLGVVRAAEAWHMHGTAGTRESPRWTNHFGGGCHVFHLLVSHPHISGRLHGEKEAHTHTDK